MRLTATIIIIKNLLFTKHKSLQIHGLIYYTKFFSSEHTQNLDNSKQQEWVGGSIVTLASKHICSKFS